MFPLVATLLLILLPFALTSWLFAPWIPISSEELERLGKLLKLKPSDTFYELGCGDGRVVRYIAKKYKCRCVGVELNPFLYLICLIGQIGYIGTNKSTFILGDLFQQNLKNADCIYLFGLPKVLNGRIKVKLEKELPKGATVVSYGFQVERWKPFKKDSPKAKLPIFAYRM